MFRPFYPSLLVLLITGFGQASEDLFDADPASMAEDIATAWYIASGDSLKSLFARQQRAAAIPQAQSAVGIEPVNPAIAACHPALADPAAAEKDMVPAKEDIAAPSIPTAVPLLAFVNAFGYHIQPQFGGLQQPFSTASARRSTTETIISSESRRVTTSEPTASPSLCPNGKKVFKCEDEPIENKVKRFSDFEADRHLGKRQDPNAEVDGYIQYCKVCDVPIPIMFFPWVDGETDELVSSTCNGMRSMGAEDQVLLHWNGIGSVSTGKRQAARCKGYCASINETYNARYDGRNECDEFPPASSREGGAGAHRQCILREQNQLGGHMYNSYAALFKLGPDSAYIIRVLPGCGGISKRGEAQVQSPEERSKPEVEARDFNSVKRQEEGDTQTIQGTSNKYIKDPRPGFPNGSGFVIVPLSEAVSGRYNVQFSLSSPVQNVSVVDGSGIEIVSPSPGDITDGNMSWDLTDDTDLSIGAYVSEDHGVNISYTGSVTPAPANSGVSATGDGLSNAKRMVLLVSNWETLALWICAWMCAWMLFMMAI